MLNSLSQTLLKITAPGVPDFYQGSELWDLRLVDPDNRGTIDFERRIELLRTLQQGSSDSKRFATQLCENWTDGRIKLYVIWKALQLRHKFSGLFTDGEFVPAEVSGQRAENVTAFFRKGSIGVALIVAPKWLAASGMENDEARSEFWSKTTISLPPIMNGNWKNAFTGEVFQAPSNEPRNSLNLSTVLGNFPVALLSLS